MQRQICPEATMPSGMHLFFVGSPADSTPFKTGWLTSENIKKAPPWH
ncbi:hypothetical protein [Eubacterium callanderi]|nr:hypothetical protein [Eubacterium callanderi]